MKNLNACLAHLNLGLPDDVRRLKEAGYYTEAIARIDTYLAEDWTQTQNQPAQPGGVYPKIIKPALRLRFHPLSFHAFRHFPWMRQLADFGPANGNGPEGLRGHDGLGLAQAAFAARRLHRSCRSAAAAS